MYCVLCMTSLCYHCVWVTTQFQKEKLGVLDRLYAECIEQKEALTRDLQVYVFEGALDAKHEIYNRRDDKHNASAAAAGAKKTAKKARRGADVQLPSNGRRLRMTDLLGDLQKLCVCRT